MFKSMGHRLAWEEKKHGRKQAAKHKSGQRDHGLVDISSPGCLLSMPQSAGPGTQQHYLVLRPRLLPNSHTAQNPFNKLQPSLFGDLSTSVWQEQKSTQLAVFVVSHMCVMNNPHIAIQRKHGRQWEQRSAGDHTGLASHTRAGSGKMTALLHVERFI